MTHRHVDETDRSEEGYAARFEEKGHCHFAAGSRPALLRESIDVVSRLETSSRESLPALPAGSYAPGPDLPMAQIPDAFEPLSQLLASESKGEARLASLTWTEGSIVESLENGFGLAGVRKRPFGFGNAHGVGVYENRRVTAHAVFSSVPGTPPDLQKIAQVLADRCRLPLKGRACPFPRGGLLLDPSVSAALICATLPLFLGEQYRGVFSRKYLDRDSRFCRSEFSLVDDARSEFAFDGEGTPVKRHAVIGEGVFRTRLHDLSTAARSGEPPTGNSIRHSFRTPPGAGSTRFFLESHRPATPGELLQNLARGLYATATAAPIRVDLENDGFSLEVEGWAVVAGKATSPVASATVAGRLSALWKSLEAAGGDLRWFPLQTLTGAPTLYFPRVAYQ
jgi:predicted Zn-dependent protease